MSFKTSLIETVYFMRWIAPQVTDHALLVRDVERIARSQGKLKAVITVVPYDLPVPDEAFRKAGANSTKVVMDWAEAVIVVIEGKGMKYSVMRAFASAMAAVGGTGDRSFAEATVEAALGRIKPQLAMPMPAVLEKLRHDGVL